MHQPHAGLGVEGVDGGLVAEGTGRLVPAVRDAWNDACVDVFVQSFESFRKDLTFVEEHVPFTEVHLDVGRQAAVEHLVGGEGGGGVGRGMVAFHVGAGKVRVVEEGGEEFGEGLFRFDAVAFLAGARLGPVE